MFVSPGIDVLLDQHVDLIQGRRIGLISNASGVTRDLTRNVNALRRRPGVQLAALFGPEHGFTTSAADAAAVASITDPRTGLPVYSLYGEVRQPAAEMLAGLDVLVFDIQSVGVRFYTYITTLLYAMQAAAAHDVAFIVCDRPNPIGGEIVEGPILESGFESFVGPGPLPVRYGMTIGELARFYHDIWGVGANLTVIPCAGWQREMWFDDTGLPWVPTSPAMPKLDTATVYPGTCLMEGTNLSEGRGTALPFEMVGAPWVDGWALADALNALELPGVKFRSVQFEPTDSKWAGKVCAGVQYHVLDRQVFRPVAAGLYLIVTVKSMYPQDFAWHPPHFDRLMGTDSVRQAVEAGVPVAEIVAGWEEDRADFMTQRRRVLLY